MFNNDNSFGDVNTKANRVYREYYDDFRLAGDGKVTSSYCGAYRSVDGCINVALHEGKKWNGKDCTGKAYIRKIHFSCKRSSCSVCYKFGWGIRQAGNIENRLNVASKMCGLEIEHIVVSVPKADYELGVKDYKALRRKVMRLMKVRGIIGGCMIFHAYRLDHSVRPKAWYASPHFHVLGFVGGGYKCRACKRKNNCLKGCGGFDDVSYQNFLKDGYYVKVLGRRKTVFGTAWYQLNHSSHKKGARRFHIATWFGICGHRLFKSPPAVKQKKECPICKHEVVKLFYVGGLLYPEKWRRERASVRESNEVLLPFREDGRVAWVIDETRGSSGGWLG